MEFTKPELLFMRDLLRDKQIVRNHRFTGETGDDIDQQEVLLDKLNRYVVSMEIGVTKSKTYKWVGDK